MPEASSFANTVILVTQNGMGSAEPALQHKLFDTYLRVLMENDTLPSALCFYADGVKLVAEGSSHLTRLRQFEQQGVHLIICSTCLDYFELTDKVQVGIVGGMGDIVEAQVRAGKVISI